MMPEFFFLLPLNPKSPEAPSPSGPWARFPVELVRDFCGAFTSSPAASMLIRCSRSLIARSFALAVAKVSFNTVKRGSGFGEIKT